MTVHTSESRSGRTAQMGVQGTERRSRGQGELHRWVYRAQRGAEESRESCTDGCTDHKEALKRPGRAAQTYVQSTQRRPIGAQEASSWAPEASKTAKLSPRGTQEAPSWAQEAPKRFQVEPKRHPRGSKLTQEAPKRLQVEPKRRPRGSKLSPRGTQERPS